LRSYTKTIKKRKRVKRKTLASYSYFSTRRSLHILGMPGHRSFSSKLDPLNTHERLSITCFATCPLEITTFLTVWLIPLYPCLGELPPQHHRTISIAEKNGHIPCEAFLSSAPSFLTPRSTIPESAVTQRSFIHLIWLPVATAQAKKKEKNKHWVGLRPDSTHSLPFPHEVVVAANSIAINGTSRKRQ